MTYFKKEKTRLNEEILHIKVTRPQLEAMQKIVNGLLASTNAKEEAGIVYFDDSDDAIIIERI